MAQTLEKPNVIIIGHPGKMATQLTRRLLKSEKFRVLPFSLTGPEIKEDSVLVDDFRMKLIKIGDRDAFAASISKSPDRPRITIDYTLPSAVNTNAEFYCRHRWDFLMGTTGGDREELERTVLNSDVLALISINMLKQVVAFQMMMGFAGDNCPGLLKGWSKKIVESHQTTKKDPSGTALSLRGDFEKLGVPFTEEDVRENMIRDQEKQLAMGVPKDALGGHGWHTYTFKSPDNNVLLSFTHNVNKRDGYVDGTLDALGFLNRKIDERDSRNIFSKMLDEALKLAHLKNRGKIYTMENVLRGE